MKRTAANNYFQQRTVAAGETVQACALKEFRGMVDKLRANGIEVIAVQDTPIPHTPDSIFPNNWVSFHDDGTVVLYPMFAENRRAERRADILQRIESEGFSIRRKVDYTGFEEENRFLEGTGESFWTGEPLCIRGFVATGGRSFIWSVLQGAEF